MAEVIYMGLTKNAFDRDMQSTYQWEEWRKSRDYSADREIQQEEAGNPEETHPPHPHIQHLV